MLFILLIGYDSDLVQVVRGIRKRVLFGQTRQQRPSFSAQSHDIQLDDFRRCASCGTLTDSTNEHQHGPIIRERSNALMPTILTTSATIDSSQASGSKDSNYNDPDTIRPP